MLTIDMQATGKNIKDKMTAKGMTVTDVQDIFGFNTPQAIFKWLRGATLPTIDNLVILANIFGTTMDDIIITNK